MDEPEVRLSGSWVAILSYAISSGFHLVCEPSRCPLSAEYDDAPSTFSSRHYGTGASREAGLGERRCREIGSEIAAPADRVLCREIRGFLASMANAPRRSLTGMDRPSAHT